MKKNYAFIVFYKKQLASSLILLAIMLIGFQTMAQSATIDFGRSSSQVQVTEDNLQSTKVTYTYSGLNTFGVEAKQGLFSEISIPGAFWVGELGTPKLPASKHLIEVPFGAEVSVKVLNYSMSEYKLSDFGIEHLIMPVQPSVRKDQEVEDVTFEYQEKLYQKDAFISHDLASVEVLGVMRSYRIARLTVAPISYNPVTGIIRVYNDIEVEVTYKNADPSLTEYVKSSTYSPYFETVKEKLLNGSSRDYPAHPDLTKYPIKYLIVSDRMFEADLAPFIQWKTKKGFKVVVAYTDVIGTSYAQIQTYVHAQYNAGTPADPAPSFVLFVGDTPQIPAVQGSSSAKMTDLYYASVDGDYFPEMYYGR
ncbi:MAG: C25 family peptidase propeptide domain-containing protein, partial [Ignavibacteria bacterium]|nr:C25 family peptidase propeptide domain-containing protein [Ignavibacteria bacterium]